MNDLVQTPDTKPGAYYVSVVDGARVGRLLGPFMNDHLAALAMVDKARDKAQEVDPRAAFYAFGTIRIPNDSEIKLSPGILNSFFDLQ